MAVFEHALFMLLLLVGIFYARLPGPRRTMVLLAAGIALVLLPPFVVLPLPWELILSLAIPILFWQNARHWLHARWRVNWQEFVLWLLTAFGLSMVFVLSGYLSWASVVLFGVVAASTLWRAVELESEVSYLSQIGPLALIFLLTEVAPAVETPGWYLGGLFSGAAVGIAVGLISVQVLPRLQTRWHGWLALGQVYVAYGFASLIDVSAIAAALISIAVYAEAGLRRGLDERSVLQPAPLNYWPVFSFFLALFVVLGWQAHQPFTMVLLFEALLGLGIGFFVAWTGRRLNVGGFRQLTALWPAAVRMGLFVFAALVLWPRSVLFDPLSLAVALGLALLLTVLAATVLPATMSLQE